jgi:hypothetical protein
VLVRWLAGLCAISSDAPIHALRLSGAEGREGFDPNTGKVVAVLDPQTGAALPSIHRVSETKDRPGKSSHSRSKKGP